MRFQQPKNFFQQAVFAVKGVIVGIAVGRETLNPNQFLRDAGGRKNIIGYAGFDRAVRHAIVLGGFKVLDKGDATGVLDGGQAQSPIARRSRKDDADGIAGLVFGQRAEKGVNRQMMTAGRFAPSEMQHAFRDRHVAIGGQNVNGVHLY